MVPVCVRQTAGFFWNRAWVVPTPDHDFMYLWEVVPLSRVVATRRFVLDQSRCRGRGSAATGISDVVAVLIAAIVWEEKSLEELIPRS